MDAELYSRVRKLEKQVEALLERHPEVRAVLERGTARNELRAVVERAGAMDVVEDCFPCDICGMTIDDTMAWVRYKHKSMCEGCAEKQPGISSRLHNVSSAIKHDPPCETCGTLSKPRRARDLLHGRHYLCDSCAATAYEV